MSKERTELRIDTNLKIKLMLQAKKLGISLNDLCEMKLAKDDTAIIAIAGNIDEFMAGLSKKCDHLFTVKTTTFGYGSETKNAICSKCGFEP